MFRTYGSFTRKLLIVTVSLGMLFGGYTQPSEVKAASATYYVDSANGDDSNAGTSAEAPWKTLEKVNSVSFEPGDHILFKSGSAWSGKLQPNGSGAAGSPIVIDKYGDGPKPIINGNSEHAVLLKNVEYITLRNLEITNDGLTPDVRSGVYVLAEGVDLLSGIHLESLDIHDVKGITNLPASSGAPGRFNNSSIYFMAQDVKDKPLASFHDVKIEDNYIHDVTTSGIYFNGTAKHAAQGADGTFKDWNTNVVIRNNVVKNTGTDGIIVAYSVHPIMEYNVSYDAGSNDPLQRNNYIAGMWSWGAKDAVWQFNEVARVNSVEQFEADSVAFDTDIISYGTHIYQYNYTHDNTGGFIMSMGQLKGENIVRYNISQNDGHNHFTNNSIMMNDKSHLYNNVFYNDKDGFRIGNNANVTYTNNIFYGDKEHRYPSNPVYDYNAYYGHEAAASDLHAVTADPQFEDPGKGADGYNTVGGYTLKSDSPLIGAGKAIADNGGRDFWGNPVYNGAPDIGAFEFTGSVPGADTVPPTAPANLKAIETTDTEVVVQWEEATDDKAVKPGYEVYNADTGALVAWTTGDTTAKISKLNAQTTYRFYVKAIDAQGNKSVPGNTLTHTTGAPGIIVDDDAVYTGTWKSSKFAPGYYGTGYRFIESVNSGTPTHTATWRPTLPKYGDYLVYYRLPDGSPGRTTNAPFTIHFDGGSQTYYVNEEVKGGEWILLGKHTFKAGTEGYVQLTNLANNSIVISDAIKFNYVESGVNAVLTGTASVEPGQSFRLQARLENVKDNSYGQHLVFRFDPNLVEFVSAEPAQEGTLLLASSTDIPGEVEFVTASAGASHGISGNEPVLNLNMKAKQNTVSRTDITIYKAIIGNNQGKEVRTGGYVHPLSIGILNSNSNDTGGNGNNGNGNNPDIRVEDNGNVLIAPKPEQSNSGKANFIITGNTWDQAVNQAKEDKDGRKLVQIDLKADKEADSYSVKVPASAVADDSKDIQLEISTPIATVSTSSGMFQNGVLTAVNAELHIATADTSKLDEQARSAIGNRPVIDLSVSAEGKTLEWSNPDSPVTIRIPYTPTAEELLDPEHITVWYVDGNGVAHAVPSGRYDPVSGTVVFSTTHFSTYAVSYVEKSFQDLGGYDWAKRQVEALASKGILQGVGAEEFDPAKPVKRADFMVMLMRTMEAAGKAEGSFTDVHPDDYYYEAVSLAQKLGVTDGMGDGRFNPMDTITRQDMMVLVERALSKLMKQSFEQSDSSLDAFKDKSDIADYAVDSMSKLAKAGLIKGDGSRLHPREHTTRAEAAVLMYNVYNLIYR